MKKTTKIIRDKDGSIKIPVYLNWSNILEIQVALRKLKIADVDLIAELRYREKELEAYLNNLKS